MGDARHQSSDPYGRKHHHCFQRFSLPFLLVVLLFYFHQGPNILVSGFSFAATKHSFKRRPSTLVRLSDSSSSRRRQATTRLYQSSSRHTEAQPTLEQVLKENGYGQRLVTISPEQLPVVAEVYSHGQLQLCKVIALIPSSKPDTPPLLQTHSLSDTEIIDLGQVTTIWENDIHPRPIASSWKQDATQRIDTFSLEHVERAMQRLYNSHVGRARSTNSGLTKKQISRLVKNAAENGAHMDQVLKKVIKAGTGMMRLVDSSVAMDYLFENYPNDKAEKVDRLTIGASVLTNDAQLGGRFKRMPCIYVSSEMNGENVASITLVNGGWLTVDQSVRAGTEARKFAERTDDKEGQLLTVADERIAHRLECLAMGEVFSWEGRGEKDNSKFDGDLELDVREALKAMDLPVSPSGAQKALVRLGRWSEGSTNRIKLEPWTKAVLEASRSYKRMDQERRRDLLEALLNSNEKGKTSKRLEGRVDLTSLPCVCVDAKRTSFPDDAIGVRPRSSTGRKVVAEASKWEVLIHITDVSDIYSPEALVDDRTIDLELLQDAAARRGTSRYDLPLGPLHLMPPIALETLSLQVIKFDETSKAGRLNNIQKGVNRCVTLWAYIDGRKGRLIDAGLERTLVSTPISLSFAGATSLLNGDLDSPELKHAKALLAVAERNLGLWSEQLRSRSKAAQKRENRFTARELVAREQGGRNGTRRDGFERTRGHKIVDSALDLYGQAVAGLLRRAKAPIPMSSGSGVSRGGRVGTAPLRRYIDGVAQRQALAVLCGYGGRPLTKEECMAASAKATQARNTLSNVRSTKRRGVMDTSKQRDALRLLKTHLKGGNRLVPAISTGRENEIVISNVGAIAKCQGVKGTLKPGDRVLVQVKKLDPERGSLSVTLVEKGR